MKQFSSRLVWVFVFCLPGFKTQAQAPALTLSKCLGGTLFESGRSMVQTPDGGFVAIGTSQSNNGDAACNKGGYDVWVVRLNSSGDILWSRCYGGSGDDYGRIIRNAPGGGFYFLADTESNNGDVSGNKGQNDFWVVELNDNGTIVRQSCRGGSNNDYAQDFIILPDGSLVVTGATASNNFNVPDNAGGYDLWMVKIPPTFTPITWTITHGGTLDDGANVVRQTSDGGFVLAGETASNDGDVSGNNGGRDLWVIKTDANGNLLWQSCLGGSDAEFANDIVENPDGTFVIAGRTKSNNGDVSDGPSAGDDAWILKIDVSGPLVWEKCFGGTQVEEADRIHALSNGSYLVTGFNRSIDGGVVGNHGNRDVWLWQIDASGAMEWQLSIGGTSEESGHDFLIDATTGNYWIIGATYSNDGDISGNHGGSEMLLLRLLPSQAPPDVVNDLQQIPAGDFQRGCTTGQQPCNPADAPPHDVSLKPFFLSRYEITQNEYVDVVGTNPSANTTCGGNCPVETVTWYDALRYCNLRSLAEGLQPCYYNDPALQNPYTGGVGTVYWDTEADGFRLPTEAEWEYAARAGTDKKYAGSDVFLDVGWFANNSGGQIQSAGELLDNDFGYFDMSGNVEEWVWDSFGSYPTGAVCDPTGAAPGAAKGYRGGNFTSDGSATVSKRSFTDASNSSAGRGFRVARNGF